MSALPPRYEVRQELGRGQMGQVMLAFDRELQREVAVKILSAGHDATVLKRFEREAQDLARLSHRNVVSFLGVGKHEGTDYIVMERIDGGTLRTVWSELPVSELLEVFAQICEGLAHIHQHEIVHRDLKPENILVGSDRIPRITDFGLSRRLAGDSDLTSMGMILGTVNYLAPEQIMSANTVGPAADLYAVGACLFESLTGRGLFPADSKLGTMTGHLKQKPPRPSELGVNVSPELEGLLLKLLEKKVEDRPASALEVSQRLRALPECKRPASAAADGPSELAILNCYPDLAWVCDAEGKTLALNTAARELLGPDFSLKPGQKQARLRLASGHEAGFTLHWSRAAWAGKPALVVYARRDSAAETALRNQVEALERQLKDSQADRVKFNELRAQVLEEELAYLRHRLSDVFRAAEPLPEWLTQVQLPTESEVHAERVTDHLDRTVKLIAYNAYLWNSLETLRRKTGAPTPAAPPAHPPPPDGGGTPARPETPRSGT